MNLGAVDSLSLSICYSFCSFHQRYTWPLCHPSRRRAVAKIRGVEISPRKAVTVLSSTILLPMNNACKTRCLENYSRMASGSMKALRFRRRGARQNRSLLTTGRGEKSTGRRSVRARALDRIFKMAGASHTDLRSAGYDAMAYPSLAKLAVATCR
jgi:hypothetical protein